MKKAPKIDATTVQNGIENWLLFFIWLEDWKMEAWGVAGAPRSLSRGVQVSHIAGAVGGGTWGGGGSL